MNPGLWQANLPLAAHLLARLSRAKPLLVLLVVFAATKGMKAQHSGQEAFESLVFWNGKSLDEVQAEFERLLTSKIALIDSSCQLSLAQRQKLELIGRGDISRFTLRFVALKNYVTDRGLPLRNPEVVQAAQPLGVAALSGLFHDQSLLCRSIRKILTAEQLLRYDAMVQKEHQVWHRAATLRLITLLDDSGPWPAKQREQFLAFLQTEVEPIRNTGTYGFAYLVIRLRQMDKGRYGRFLPQGQQQWLERFFETIQPFEISLRQAGYFSFKEEAYGGNLTVPFDPEKKK